MSSSPIADSDFSESTNFAMDGDGSDALHVLSQGFDVTIVMQMKAIFDKIITGLELDAPPVFTTVDCGDAGVRVTIKLNVSNLPSVTGNRIWYAVVEGETLMDHAAAELSAIKSALKLLEDNHLIRIVDFSSMIAKRLNAKNTHELLSSAIGALQNVLVQWDLTLSNCQKIVSNLEEQESKDNIFAPRTRRGMVYGYLSDYLSHLLSTFSQRTNDVKKGLTESQADLASYQHMIEEKMKNCLNNVPFHHVSLPPKYILEYVMSFYGLGIPQYSCKPDNDGFVKSKVVFNFPYLDNFKYGGQISITGKSFCSAEADEEAALQALIFIEENFQTKVVDYNYSKRKKAFNDDTKLCQKLSDLLDLADSVKMMFGELISAIEGQRLQFSFDPISFFEGPTSTGPIDAYHFCSTTLVELDDFSAKCYRSCDSDFILLNKITWKLLVLKTNPLM